MSENYYTTDLDATAEDFAEKYIRESAETRDAVAIGEFMESEGLIWDDAKEADWDKLRERIYLKIATAELDIYWSEGR